MANSLVYNTAKRGFLGESGYGPIDADTDVFNIILVTSTYTNIADATKQTHRYRSDLTGEVANGNGYTTGGQALSGVAISLSTNTVIWDFTSDPVWASASFTATGAVIAKITGGNVSTPADDPLVAYLDFGGSFTASGGNFLVTINSNGIITLT